MCSNRLEHDAMDHYTFVNKFIVVFGGKGDDVNVVTEVGELF